MSYQEKQIDAVSDLLEAVSKWVDQIDKAWPLPNTVMDSRFVGEPAKDVWKAFKYLEKSRIPDNLTGFIGDNDLDENGVIDRYGYLYSTEDEMYADGEAAGWEVEVTFKRRVRP